MNTNTISLGEVLTTIRNGLNTPQFDSPTEDEMLPISRIETISSEEINFERVKYAKVSESDRSKYLLREGDILFSHINSPKHIGKTGLYNSTSPLIHGVNLLLLRPNQDVCHPKYLDYYLKSKDVRNWFRHRCKKAVNQASLNQQDIKGIEIPLPPLTEQQRIAGILGRADRLRRLRRYALELSEGYLQAVFLEMFGDYFRKEKSLSQLGDFVKITGGGTPARKVEHYYKGTIPWLTSKDMRGDYIWDTQEHITEEAIKNSATNLIPRGSILIVVKSKILMRKLPLAIAMEPMCHGQDIKSIQCPDKIDPRFLVQVIKFNERRLLDQARGANTEGLTLPMLRELPVPEVENSAQRQFCDIVVNIERLHAQQREALRQAEHLFQALLQRAFRGEV